MLWTKAISAAGTGVGAIEYVGGHIVAGSSAGSGFTLTFGGNLTGGSGSSAQAGDLVILYQANSGSPVSSTVAPSGYTTALRATADDSFDAALGVFYKIMGGTPDTSVAVSSPGATNNVVAGVQVWRNVDPLIVFGQLPLSALLTNSVLADPPSITPTTSGAVIVAAGAGAHNRTGATYSSSDLTAFRSAGNSGATNLATLGFGYNVWTSGAFNPAAFTFSDSDSVSFAASSTSGWLFPEAQRGGPVPTYIAKADTQNIGTATTLVINKPAGTAEGDLMLLVAGAETNGIRATPPSGWTEVFDGDNAGGRSPLYIAYKVAGSSEPSSYTLTFASTTRSAGSILTYRNAAYDTIGTITTNVGNVPGVTVSNDYGIVFVLDGHYAKDVSFTAPTLFSTVVTNAVDGEPPSYSLYSRYAPAGSTGTITGGTTDTGGNTSSIAFAIKPA